MVSYYKPYEIENEKENETGAKTKDLIKNVGKTIKKFASEHKIELVVVGAMYISYKIGSLVTANSIKNQVFEMAMNGEITFNKN